MSNKGQERRFKDPYRAVQDEASTNLVTFLNKFEGAESGNGSNRIQCLTHDTKRALIQTTRGMFDLCSYLLQIGFKYVLLREIQTDRIEGVFVVYRQSTGANSYMSSADVTSAFKRRLTRFAASFLESLDNEVMNPSTAAHDFLGDIFAEDASSIEKILSDTPVSPNEGRASAYVAGWLEFECCQELSFGKDDQLLDTK